MTEQSAHDNQLVKKNIAYRAKCPRTLIYYNRGDGALFNAPS